MKRFAFPKTAGVLILIWGTAVAMTGCSRQATPGVDDTTSQTKSKAPAQKIRAYVRLDTLEAGHPLHADLDRLARAETDLRRAASAGAGRPAGSGEALALPALGAPGDSTQAAAAADARESRRAAARAELNGTFDTRMGEFVAERGRRQMRLEDQLRDELTALGAIKLAEQERLARDAADAETRLSLQAKVGDVTQVQAGLSVLDAQLDPASLLTWYSAPLSRDELESQITRIKAGIDTYDLSTQSYLELKRRIWSAKSGTLDGELADIRLKGGERADNAAKHVAELGAQSIESDIESVHDDAETRFVARAQGSARDRALEADQSLATRAEAERRELLNGAPGSASGAFQMGEVFPAGPGAIDPAGALRAADKVAAERERLRQFIEADVSDTVRDVAQRRNMDVVLITGTASTPGDPRLTGRRDMTDEFGRWMQPGAAVAMPALGASPARPAK